MNVALTNYGLRYTVEHCREDSSSKGDCNAECKLLLDLWAKVLAPYQGQPAYDHLLAQGLIEQIPETLSKEDVALRYRRNPLEHVDRVIFEYTTHCNFNCRHCYNARVKEDGGRKN